MFEAWSVVYVNLDIYFVKSQNLFNKQQQRRRQQQQQQPAAAAAGGAVVGVAKRSVHIMDWSVNLFVTLFKKK